MFIFAILVAFMALSGLFAIAVSYGTHNDRFWSVHWLVRCWLWFPAIPGMFIICVLMYGLGETFDWIKDDFLDFTKEVIHGKSL
jgi:hypothetical protein